MNTKQGSNRTPDRVTLNLPEASKAESTHPRCGSCGLFLVAAPHGTQQDCIDALRRELDALRRIADRS